MPSREGHDLHGVSWSNGSRMSRWAASQSDAAKEQVLEEDPVDYTTGSQGQNEEAVHREEYRNLAAERTNSPRLPKNENGGRKKRWHRGRLVAIDEDEIKDVMDILLLCIISHLEKQTILSGNLCTARRS